MTLHDTDKECDSNAFPFDHPNSEALNVNTDVLETRNLLQTECEKNGQVEKRTPAQELEAALRISDLDLVPTSVEDSDDESDENGTFCSTPELPEPKRLKQQRQSNDGSLKNAEIPNKDKKDRLDQLLFEYYN